MDRRAFLKLSASVATCACLTATGGLLAGCSKTLYQSHSFEDKSKIPDKDISAATSGEPTVTLKLLAVESMAAVLPELQTCYRGLHSNVVFDDTVFVPSHHVMEQLKAGSFDGVLLESGIDMNEVLEVGLSDDSMRVSLFSSRVAVIASEDLSLTFKSIADVADSSVERIVLGDPASVYSGRFANQALASEGLYSKESGEDGAYDDSVGSRVEVKTSLSEILDAVESGSATVGIVLLSEALCFGIDPLFEVPRTKYRTIGYQGAALFAGQNMAYALDFLKFCQDETEAEKVGELYGFPES